MAKEKGYNTLLYVVAGLQNTYNVFSLWDGTKPGASTTPGAYDTISVDIIIDGRTYVENDETSFLHGKESSFKEFGGIMPTLLAGQYDNTKYGKALYEIIKDYFPVSYNENAAEIYGTEEAYLLYQNQFKVEFKDNISALGTYMGGNKSYITYKQEEEFFTGHKYYQYYLKGLRGTNEATCLLLNADIIHFSKYYGIYSLNTVPIPQLEPILYDVTSLNEYNLSIHPEAKYLYPNILWSFHIQSGKRGGKDPTWYMSRPYIADDNARYHHGNPNYTYNEGTSRDFDDCGHDISQFKSNSWLADCLTNSENNEAYWSAMPKGFYIIGMSDSSSEYMELNGDNAGDRTWSNKKLPNDYLKTFKVGNRKDYSFEEKYISDGNYGQSLVSLAYHSDSDGNPHILNCWVPVQRYRDSEGYVLNTIIQYNTGIKNRPIYLGQILAAVLANIYVYRRDSPPEVAANYVSDVIYLTDNATTYTKDIVYYVKFNPPSNLTDFKPNNVLLLNGVSYNDYLNTVLNKAGINNNNKNKVNRNNVDITLKECIKNIPLQYKLKYIEPELGTLNQLGNLTYFTDITGYNTILYMKPEANRLYQTYRDESGELQVKFLDSDFSLRYLKNTITIDSLSLRIIGEWDDSIIPERNADIKDTFKAEDGVLVPKKDKVTTSKGKYYSIVGEFVKPAGLKDIVKAETLAPFANIFLG